MRIRLTAQQQGNGSLALNLNDWQKLLKLNGGNFSEDNNGFRFSSYDNEYTINIKKGQIVVVHNPLFETYSFTDFFGNAYITRTLNPDGTFGFIIESHTTPNGFRLMVVLE